MVFAVPKIKLNDILHGSNVCSDGFDPNGLTNINSNGCLIQE